MATHKSTANVLYRLLRLEDRLQWLESRTIAHSRKRDLLLFSHRSKPPSHLDIVISDILAK